MLIIGVEKAGPQHTLSRIRNLIRLHRTNLDSLTLEAILLGCF
jgi:hypothetical protein